MLRVGGPENDEMMDTINESIIKFQMRRDKVSGEVSVPDDIPACRK